MEGGILFHHPAIKKKRDLLLLLLLQRHPSDPMLLSSLVAGLVWWEPPPPALEEFKGARHCTGAKKKQNRTNKKQRLHGVRVEGNEINHLSTDVSGRALCFLRRERGD